MQIQIKNDHLTCMINEKGAELNSLINHEGINFLWNGDEKFWSGISPILFPIVGRVKDGKYKIGDNIYNLNIHGFANNSNFQLVEKLDSSCSFLLSYSQDTLKHYPFKFSLIVSYSLNVNCLNILYEVKNIDVKDMYFSIGSHPAFNFPLFKEESYDDYYLEFSEYETLNRYLVNDDGLIKRSPILFLNHERKIFNIKDMVKDTTLVLKDPKSEYISIKNTKNPYEIKVKIKNYWYLCIWSYSLDAPFLCIEPWQGIADYEDTDGELSNKDGIIKVEPGEIFTNGYSIEVKK